MSKTTDNPILTIALPVLEKLELDIIYQDDYLVAINKPHGLLVHRTPTAKDATVFAVQTLRNQIGKHVHPVHRVDRKTSGVLLFSLDGGITREVQQQFNHHTVFKEYIAIVRGHFPDRNALDYTLTDERGVSQSAVTLFECIEQFELPIPFGKWPTSRYSLIKAFPKTGRTHQIRRHLAHLRHPIIGDRPHGCNKQNKFWKEKWQMTRMLIQAKSLSLTHPVYKEMITFSAEPSMVFSSALSMLRRQLDLTSADLTDDFLLQ